MKIQKEKIRCLLYDFIELQKKILLDKESILQNNIELKLFAINLCKLIEFKNIDKSTFNNLVNKNYEEYSIENNVDFSINNKEFYYRIEFNFDKRYNPYIGGRVTILNYASGGYYGYRIYFGYINTNKKLKNVRFINQVRVDEYLNGITIKSTTVKIPRSFIMSTIQYM